jgi:hypothetical protein
VRNVHDIATFYYYVGKKTKTATKKRGIKKRAKRAREEERDVELFCVISVLNFRSIFGLTSY